MKYLMLYGDGTKTNFEAGSIYGAMSTADIIAAHRCRTERLRRCDFQVISPEGYTVYESHYALKTANSG